MLDIFMRRVTLKENALWVNTCNSFRGDSKQQYGIIEYATTKLIRNLCRIWQKQCPVTSVPFQNHQRYSKPAIQPMNGINNPTMKLLRIFWPVCAFLWCYCSHKDAHTMTSRYRHSWLCRLVLVILSCLWRLWWWCRWWTGVASSCPCGRKPAHAAREANFVQSLNIIIRLQTEKFF